MNCIQYNENRLNTVDQTLAADPICHEDIVQQSFCTSHKIEAMVQIPHSLWVGIIPQPLHNPWEIETENRP